MMLQVARASSNGSPVSMTSISRETEISKSYLEQLAIPLKAAGLLHGRTGRAGGYTLARPPAEIRVREVVEATIGSVDLVECVGKPEQCTRAGECETRLIWALMTSRLQSMLDGYTLADLADANFIAEVRQEIGSQLATPRRRVKPARSSCGSETRTRRKSL